MITGNRGEHRSERAAPKFEQLASRANKTGLRRVEPEDGSTERVRRSDGHWKEAAPSWDAEPDALLERQEFRDVLKACMGKMPGRMAHLFWLREAEDVQTETICKELEITPTNAWTLLHRARLSLRRCLNENWFKEGDR